MRYFLLPISWIYRSVVYFRNQLFDRKFIAAQGYKNSIGVGNSSMGGTGKSPLTIYIAEIILKNKGEPALLSRGYGRKTKVSLGRKKQEIRFPGGRGSCM